MPQLRTDDGPRKLRAVWLGPKGGSLPFEWTYVQWVATIMLMPLGIAAGQSVIALVARGLTGDWQLWFAIPIGACVGGFAGVWLSVWLMRNVTFDEPLRHKMSVAKSELGRKTRKSPRTTETWVMPWPTITDEN